ncbi:hypothetical protein HPB47_015021, partial [Ixodes persulcatus]
SLVLKPTEGKFPRISDRNEGPALTEKGLLSDAAAPRSADCKCRKKTTAQSCR